MRKVMVPALIASAALCAFTICIYFIYPTDYNAQQGIGQLVGGAASAISFIWIIVQLQLQITQLKKQDEEIARNTEELIKQSKSIEYQRTLTHIQTMIQLKVQICATLDRLARAALKILFPDETKLSELFQSAPSGTENIHIWMLDNVKGLSEKLEAQTGHLNWKSLQFILEQYVISYELMIGFDKNVTSNDERVVDDLLANSAESHLYKLFKRALNFKI